MGDLIALKKRVDEATGPDWGLTLDIECALKGLTTRGGYVIGRAGAYKPAAYTASIDAALALVERMLPGCKLMIDTRAIGGETMRAKLFPPPIVAHNDLTLIGYGATLPLAIVSALLAALIAKDASNVG